MTRFVVPAAVAMVVGLLLGAAAVFGHVSQNSDESPPEVQHVALWFPVAPLVPVAVRAVVVGVMRVELPEPEGTC